MNNLFCRHPAVHLLLFSVSLVTAGHVTTCIDTNNLLASFDVLLLLVIVVFSATAAEGEGEERAAQQK